MMMNVIAFPQLGITWEVEKVIKVFLLSPQWMQTCLADLWGFCCDNNSEKNNFPKGEKNKEEKNREVID